MDRDNHVSDEAILRLYQEGKGQREISRLVGISQPAVRKRLIKLGVLQPDNHKVITCPECGSTSLWVCIYDSLHCSVCSPPRAEVIKEPLGVYYRIG